eukprot:gene5625-13628_t
MSMVRDSLLEPGLDSDGAGGASIGPNDDEADEVLWTADGSVNVNIDEEDVLPGLPSDGSDQGGPHVYSLLGTGASVGGGGGGNGGVEGSASVSAGGGGGGGGAGAGWSIPGSAVVAKRGSGLNVPQAQSSGGGDGGSGGVRPFSVFRTEENLPAANKTDERVITLKQPEAKASYGFTLKTARIPKLDATTRQETGEFVEPTYVETVNPAGSGYAAGLRAGDHILNIDHYQVENAHHDHIVKLLKESRERVEINRKLLTCRSEIINQKAELEQIEQIETALEAAKKAGTFEVLASSLHKQALLQEARHAEESAAAKRHQSLAIATARKVSPLRGSTMLPGPPPGAKFEIRWGSAATSAKLPQPPPTGMIQVNKVNNNTRVVKCELVGPASPSAVAAPSPSRTESPPKSKSQLSSSSSLGSAASSPGRDGGTAVAASASSANGSKRSSSSSSPALPLEDLCTFNALDIYPATEWDTQLPLLVLAMQDQWKAERVKWRKREADLEAISEQCRKELDTLKAIVKAKAVSPTYVSPVERTSMVSWSGIGVLPEGAAVTATAAAATLGADSPSGDGLPPMPGSTPPDRPRKYTATEWV